MQKFNFSDFIERNPYFPMALMGLFLLGFGMLFFYWMGQTTKLICTRLQNQRVDCRLETTFLGTYPMYDQRIGTVRSASVEENCDSDGCTYRVLLQTANAPVPLTDFFSSGEGAKQKKVEQINAFVRDEKTKNLQIKDGTGLWSLAVLPFSLFGIGMILKPLIDIVRRSIWSD